MKNLSNGFKNKVMKINEPSFQVVTQETLEKMSLKFYGGGKELKEGDLIIPGFTIGYANINGHPPPSYHNHDDASNLILSMFVWDRERKALFQLYKTLEK